MKFTVKIAFLLLSVMVFLLGACSSPHKAKKLDTEFERSQNVQGEEVGIKDGKLVVQRKIELAERLRRLQNDVYELEDRVYGNRKFGSKGLYGVLKDCKIKTASRELGGDGKLRWMEKIERVTDIEDDFELGIDEKDQLVAVKEEFLKDRIKRFKKHRKTLQSRQDEYEENLDICKADLASKQYDAKKQ